MCWVCYMFFVLVCVCDVNHKGFTGLGLTRCLALSWCFYFLLCGRGLSKG